MKKWRYKQNSAEKKKAVTRGKKCLGLFKRGGLNIGSRGDITTFSLFPTSKIEQAK